jgi:hypothetical protein
MAMCCGTSSTCGLPVSQEAASFCREVGMARQRLDEALPIRISVFSRIDFHRERVHSECLGLTFFSQTNISKKDKNPCGKRDNPAP